MRFNLFDVVKNNLCNIPSLVLEQRRFCLWRYFRLPNSSKLSKVPYGINFNNSIVRSLKNEDNWLTMRQVELLVETLPFDQVSQYGLGLVLIGGPYVVIDLDNCVFEVEGSLGTFLQILPEADEIIRLFPGAYCEMSPSGKGIHILFLASWHEKRERSSVRLNNLGTVEVYSGHSCRFITLTGDTKFLSEFYGLKKNAQIGAFLSDSGPLHKIYRKFFSPPLKSPSRANSEHIFKDEDFKIDKDTVLPIISLIKKQNKYAYFEKLALGGIAPSKSEDDWRFCYFILQYVDLNLSEYCIVNTVCNLWLTYRPYRVKLQRISYLRNTVLKVLHQVKKTRVYNQTRSISGVPIKHTDLLRVCNQMNIFHLSKSSKMSAQIYTFGEGTDNYLKVSTLYSLTASDLDYFFAILKQLKDSKKVQLTSEKQYAVLDLNVSLMAIDLKLCDSGQFRVNLIKFLERMSHLTISYNKKITSEGLFLKGAGNLMTYNALLKASGKSKKIQVYLNRFIYSILEEATYNYRIINFYHSSSLPNSQMRLIYNYICLKTVPGASYFTCIFLDHLLQDLWLKSDNASTIRSRRKRLIELLSNFSDYIHNLTDLVFCLENKSLIINYDFNPVIKVKRKRVKLNFKEPF